VYRRDSPNILFVDTDSGFTTIFTAYGTAPWVYDVRFYVPSDFIDRPGFIGGLLGTPDGDKTNEFTMPNGTIATNPRDFHESWALDRDNSLIAQEDVLDKRISTRSLFAEWDRRAATNESSDLAQSASRVPAFISGSEHTLAYALENLAWSSAATKEQAAAACSVVPADMGFGCAYDLFVSVEFGNADEATRLSDAARLSIVLGEYSAKGVSSVKVQGAVDKAVVTWEYADKEALGVQIRVQQTPALGGWKTFRADRPLTSFVLQGLKAGSSYEVRVAPIYADDGLLKSGSVGTFSRRSASNVEIVGSFTAAPFQTENPADGNGNVVVISAAAAGSLVGVGIVSGMVVLGLRRRKNLAMNAPAVPAA
jgi:hypothetical protein